jgi:hypothetical protein
MLLELSCWCVALSCGRERDSSAWRTGGANEPLSCASSRRLSPLISLVLVLCSAGPGFLISWALGLRPSKDVLWTTEVQPTKTSGAGCGGGFQYAQHYTAELDLVLALFSTGPVGIGDALNFTNATRARATASADGTLLQVGKSGVQG